MKRKQYYSHFYKHCVAFDGAEFDTIEPFRAIHSRAYMSIRPAFYNDDGTCSYSFQDAVKLISYWNAQTKPTDRPSYQYSLVED